MLEESIGWWEKQGEIEERIRLGSCSVILGGVGGWKNGEIVRLNVSRDRNRGSSGDSRLRGSRRSILIGLPHVFDVSCLVWPSR